MSVAAAIKEKLDKALSPLSIEVNDDSIRHAGHAGSRAAGESHFSLKIVSSAFAGKSRIERQRMVYAALADEFAAGLHALAMKTLTPDEAD
ncbi:MAG: transcriptional regulator [Rhodospirillales bacterium RIFCSPLOWO2_12_FULL_58_28]|nr:MAG: transcriptional regulator [Rhodospirillales bacterium RIFCSPLOWO2_02_FULL_58_16]OHC78051.1 MAG: transcriptional regulator [Rhodospirillales bacterium RIFCSPLOWO2_12_FULL_58_28]